MAKQAQKKIALQAEKVKPYVTGVMIALILLQAFRLKTLSEMGWFGIFGQGFLVVACYMSYSWLMNQIQTGGDLNYPLDIFILNGVVQLGSTFHSDKWWWLYLAVPAYLLSKAGGLLLSFCKNRASSPSAAAAEKSKRQIKREAKEEKFGGARVQYK